jgi:uncharacterized protein with beta-barrel porin domain
MRRTALLRRLVFLVLLVLVFQQTAAADNQSAYNQAVAEAQANAQNPSAWTVTNLKVITGQGSGDGNTYVDGKLVASTFTKQSYYSSAYPGKTMAVYGTPTTSATWVTIGGELKSYWAGNGVTAANVKLETSRVLGMSATNSNDTIVEMLVSPGLDTIQRPTKDPSTAAQPASLGTAAAFVQPAGMSDGAFSNFKAYYANWMAEAYGSSNFPWTQLGYTYRWGLGDALSDIRGLSEFIVPGGTNYTVYAVYSLTSYLYTAGNGSGDFRITGDLDTLWAGRLFQPRGESVVIAPGAMVSGGQGILISSPGYTLVNGGAITGATATKFGISGTENVAVLFLGRNAVAGSLAAPAGGANILINTGVIESPGTAVRADAGDTLVVNTGSIAGGEYAIRTGAGSDTVIVHNGTLSGNVDLGGGQDSLLVSGDSTLAFSLSPLGTAAPVQNVKTVSLGPGTSLSLTFAGNGYVANGQTYPIVRAESLAMPDAGIPVTSNLPMVRFSTVTSGNSLSVTGFRDMGWYSRLSANHSLGAALDGVTATVNPAMESLIGGLDQSVDPACATSQLAPGLQTRTTVLAVNAASAFGSAFAGRMQGLRGVSGGLGLAPAGFMSQDVSLPDIADLTRSVAKGRTEFAATPWRAALPAAGGEGAEVASQGPWEVFGSLYGAHGLGSGSGSAPGYASDLTGVLAGVGGRVFPGLRLGLVGGYAWSRTDYHAGKGQSEDHIWRAGPYVSLDMAPYAVDAMLAYGWHRVHAERPVPFVGGTAASDSPMRDLLGSVRASRSVALGSAFVAEPFVEAQYLWLHRDAYGESGAGAANLTFPAADSTSLASVLGLRLEKTFDWGALALRPEIWGGWRHEYADVAPSVRAAFAGAPDQTFVTAGHDADRDQARLGAGLSLRGRGGQALSVRFDNTVGATRSDMSLALGLRLAF